MITYLKNSILSGLSVLLLTTIVLGVVTNKEKLFEGEAASTSIIIAEVFEGGSNTTLPLAAYKNDYVMLYNKSSSSQTLTNWSLQIGGASFSDGAKTTINTTILSKCYFLIKLSTTGTSGLDLPSFDQTTSTPSAIGALSLKIALVNNRTLLASTNASSGPTVVDFFAYGTPNDYEGAAFSTTSLAADLAMTRKVPMVDHDNNSTDFELATPKPVSSTNGSQETAAETYSTTFLSTTANKTGNCTSEENLGWSNLNTSFTSLSRAARTEFIESTTNSTIVEARTRYLYLRNYLPVLTNFANL